MRERNVDKSALRSMRLYALLCEAQCQHDWQDTVRELALGGVDVVQLREKNLADEELLSRARWLRRTAREYGMLCIINDRPDVAILAEADGVHLGEEDLPTADVRELVGRDLIIGRSTHSPEQARKAEANGADYIGAGPAFATETKGYEQGVGLRLIADIVASTSLPVVAIGGIGLDNVSDVRETGATAIAACSALCHADKPRRAAENMRDAGGEKICD